MVGVILGKRALPIYWHCLDAIASGLFAFAFGVAYGQAWPTAKLP
ncbi:hypothetical protein LYNGBM3L_34110 [Moorena producens 3L]|uniref:Uncharacterized protein n=1 Tax=Moorena producens 3L TaxID=489825 RepID=F4XPH1_9CYAN|nr:hypothetical protein LYNGBM3L_34110 [Moorena producens 3L]